MTLCRIIVLNPATACASSVAAKALAFGGAQRHVLQAVVNWEAEIGEAKLAMAEGEIKGWH